MMGSFRNSCLFPSRRIDGEPSPAQNRQIPAARCGVFFLFVLLGCVGASGTTGARAQSGGDWQGRCEITFSGTSPLQNFEGKVSAEPFVVRVSNIDQKQNAGLAAVVRVKAAGMDTDEKKRDAKMHETLQVTKHPEIRVRLPEGMTVEATRPVLEGGVPRPTVVPFVLTLLGKDQELLGTISDWNYADGVARCKVSFTVSLEKSGIKAPTVLGLIRVADEIKVEAALSMRSPDAGGSSGR